MTLPINHVNIDVNKQACLQQRVINSQRSGSWTAQPEATAGSAVKASVLKMQA